MQYQSEVIVESRRLPGVRFNVERMSFGRRLELIRQLKGLAGRLAFVEAGPPGAEQQAEAALLAGEIDRIYLGWGLRGVEGLEIDGEMVTPESVVEKGPEGLVDEILEAIRGQAGLSEAERKNSESPSIFSAASKPDGSATIAAV